MKLLDVGATVAAEQPHQVPHFGFRTTPVLGRERVQRQILEADLAGRTHHFANRGDAPHVSRFARQQAVSRPTAVAIHDDGDVLGQMLGKGRRCSFKNGFAQMDFLLHAPSELPLPRQGHTCIIS
jgi:hypothetical protein